MKSYIALVTIEIRYAFRIKRKEDCKHEIHTNKVLRIIFKSMKNRNIVIIKDYKIKIKFI